MKFLQKILLRMIVYAISSKLWESCEEWHHARHQHYPERFPQNPQGYYPSCDLTNFHVLFDFCFSFVNSYDERTKHELVRVVLKHVGSSVCVIC